MSFIRRHAKLLLVGGSCALIGGGASAIAASGAAPGSGNQPNQAAPQAQRNAAGRRRLHRALLARAVHGDVVVATRNGFATVTLDRGFVQSVNGQQLTIREGTRTKTYKTVTLTIPTTAIIRNNGHTAKLSDLQQGERVAVVQAPNRTLVRAATPRARQSGSSQSNSS